MQEVKRPAPARTPAPSPLAVRTASDAHSAADDDTLSMRTAEWSVDLRGMRVEDALEAIDVALDRAVVRNARGVCVVHGVGTGALRKASREHLKRHAQVERFRPGVQGEGGDGVTFAWVKRD